MTTTDDPVSSWASRVLTAAAAHGPVPEYGSPAWLALPNDDPRRLGSLVLAGEAWRAATAHADGEIDAVRAARPAVAWARRIDTARAAGSDLGLPVEVRRELARRPRSDDHPGGPVPITSYQAMARRRRPEDAA